MARRKLLRGVALFVGRCAADNTVATIATLLVESLERLPPPPRLEVSA